MGGGASKKIDPLQKCINEDLAKTMHELGLKKADVLPLWKQFSKIDVDGTGGCDIDEIFMSNRIPETEWGRRVFGAIDIDGSGNLTFAEFFVGLYNYLAGDQNFVQKLAFDMCDVDGGGKLSVDELRQLLTLVHGKGPAKKGAKELNKKIKNLMNQLDGDRSGTVTFAEFQAQGKKIASLFKPAFELQAQLRKAFLGKAFWKKQTTRRVSVLGNKDIIKLHNELYSRSGEANMRMHEMLQAEEEARRERKARGKRNDDDFDSDDESAAADDDFDEYESD